MARRSRIAAQDKAWELLAFIDPLLPDPTGRRAQLAHLLDSIFQSKASLEVLETAVHALELAYLLGKGEHPPG